MDVSDLFDHFHALAAAIWRDFGFAVDSEAWDDIIDSLEHDLFLAGCAKRLFDATGEELEPDEVPGRIRLVSGDDEVPGAAGQYHSHAFYPDEDGAVPNAIMTGNLLSKSRDDVALILGDKTGRRQNRRPLLPQIP